MTFTKALATFSFSWQKISHRKRLRWITKGLVGAMALASCQPTAPPPSSTNLPTAPQTPTAAISSSPDIKVPPPPPSNSYLAQLPPDATNQLVQLDINIVIPTYLTQNMNLVNYEVGETADNGSAYYWLIYRDGQNRCFAIEYASEGIENSSLENQESLDSSLFGEGYYLYHGKFPNGGDGELPESDLFTDWLAGDDGFYRLIGAGLVNTRNYGQSDCTNITVDEAIAIAESLGYLPTDIKTLELIPTQPEASEENSTP
ncbi:MAG: hypothetical protein AAGF93_05785 [Cyanobacteria bacterium P01_H01_bin.105]